MVPLEKTIICEGLIPLDLLNTNNLKLVIIKENENLITIANEVAKMSPVGVSRIVIWVKNVDLNSLSNQFPDLNIDINDCYAFSLSTTNKICSRITSTSIIDKVEIDDAYIEAGKRVNN